MRRRHPYIPIALLLSLAGCSEYDLREVPDPPDLSVCALSTYVGDDARLTPECGAFEEVVEPWAMTEEWSFTGGDNGLERSSYAPPLVARIHDSNDDGVLDDKDHPNIVVVTFSNDLATTREGSLVVLDGKTGDTVMEVAGIYYGTGHAIGDVDADGWPDIVAFDAGRRVLLLDRFGNLIWRTVASADSDYPQATIADLDGNGVPEVIADNLVINGRTGEVKATLRARSGIPFTTPAVGDIDLDGKQEVVYGNTVYDHRGNAIWGSSVQGDYGHFTAILQADADREGEVLMLGANRLMLFDTDGTQLHSSDLPRRAGSQPCVADFDGDGQSEVAFALTDGRSSDPALFQVYEIDGQLLWSTEVTDASGIAGCSGYDFDGDGTLEILYADETDLYVFDGPTGDIRIHSADHLSGTVYEYPVIADVDLDGAAEMLTVRSGLNSDAVLTVWGHDGKGWAPSGTEWPLHDFAVGRLGSNGEVPSSPPLFWVEHNSVRARPVVDFEPVDWQIEALDACAAACRGHASVLVSAAVVNVGTQLVNGVTPVTLYAEIDGEPVALATEKVPMTEPGSKHLVSFETTWSAVSDATALFARVDDIGTGSGIWPECLENNNVATWEVPQCD